MAGDVSTFPSKRSYEWMPTLRLAHLPILSGDTTPSRSTGQRWPHGSVLAHHPTPAGCRGVPTCTPLPACLPQWCLVQDLLQVWLTNETSLRPWHHTIYLIYLICMKLETSTRKLRRFFLNLCLFCRSSELERLFELVRLWNAVASLDFTVGFCCFSSNSWTSLWYSSCSQNNKGSKASAAWPANSNLKSSKRRICRRILKKW